MSYIKNKTTFLTLIEMLKSFIKIKNEINDNIDQDFFKNFKVTKNNIKLVMRLIFLIKNKILINFQKLFITLQHFFDTIQMNNI